MKTRYTEKREAFYNEIKNLEIKFFTSEEIEIGIKFKAIKKQFSQIEKTIENAQKAALNKMKEKYKLEGEAEKKFKKEKSYSKLEEIKRLCRKIRNSQRGFSDKRAKDVMTILWNIKALSKRSGTSFMGDTLDYSKTRKKFECIYKDFLSFMTNIVNIRNNIKEDVEMYTKKINKFFKTYTKEIKQIPWPVKLVREFLVVLRDHDINFPWQDNSFMANTNYQSVKSNYIKSLFNLRLSIHGKALGDFADESSFKEGIKIFVETVLPIIDEFDFTDRIILKRHLQKLKNISERG